jgi:hypothetical protein
VINDVAATAVASGAVLFVTVTWITINFGKNPRNGGCPPKYNYLLFFLVLQPSADYGLLVHEVLDHTQRRAIVSRTPLDE